MVLGILLAIALQTPAPPPTTATVRGKIVAKDTGAPLRHAHVLLRHSGNTGNDFSITADENGKFEIRNVEPGTYATLAAKPGFVSAASQTPAEDPLTLKLSAGQVEENVDFRLARTGVISGTVRDMDGEPIVDATIQPMTKIYRQGRMELSPRSGSVSTDDRGEYRLHDLPAGRYYIQAGKRGNSWQGNQGPAPYSTMLFPNAPSVDGSQAVVVAAGEERRGINFNLPQAPGYNVSGVVEDADGQPVRGTYVYVRPAGNGAMGSGGGSTSGADGAFRIANLPAGEYFISGTIPSPPGKASNAAASFQRDLEITSGDVTNMIIRMSPRATVRGKVQAEGGELPAKLNVNLSAHNASGRPGNFHQGATAPDGTFAIDNVEPGSWDLAVVVNGAGGAERSIFVSAAKAGGQDALDGPFTVPEGGASVEVAATIDFRGGEIKGKTLDIEGNVLPTSGMALVSADPKKRLMTRYTRTLKSGRDGSFRLWNLVPGDYFLVIWGGDLPGQVLDPDVWIMLEKHAIPVTVERGAKMTQDLRMTRELKTIAEAFSQ